MASDGLGGPEDHRDDGTHLTEAGVPVDSNSGKVTLKATEESAQRDEDGVNVCQFFLMGKCHFGHRCRLTHSDPSIDDSGSAPPDQNDEQDREKVEKQKRKVNKATKPKYEAKEVNKKPRMRTADEVISRILWDPSVDSSEFLVGYVDRFLGVLERPFNDFNWDTDLCDCDYSTEMALPRHRIQYFTYRGHRVWDRHSRTDRVFGSTGQSLAPPFGGEAEVKEINTEAQEQQQQDLLNTTEEQPPAVCGQEESETEDCSNTKNTHLEEEKPSERNTHTPDSAQAAPKCRGNTSQEQQESRGARVLEEAVIRLEVSIDQMSLSQKEGACVNEEGEEKTSAEWQESWEDEDATSQNPSAPLEQREEVHGGGRPPKKQPTHFITFRANTPAILSSFQQLQEEITSLLPSSAPYWQTASSLHVTLCLLSLPGPAEVAAAGEILRRFAHLDRNPPVALTFPVRLKHFNGRVLFLSPQPQLHLQQLNSGLQEAYRKEGWLHRESYNPRYHLTLAKVDGKEGDRIFEEVGHMKVGKGLNFGRLPVNTLHLCAMGGPKVDGFYETVCTVTLR
ncbi:leukocyte receptor cluster member 9 isoform X1 [Micropterus dolomieu]|uniref:leukocyte receptor cluster member 9 isoform X1 n=1 Tax=Micropterus dolomieu TaxID=147949 RepID=UPI001E8EEA67|nr:leukocyte receptor cluster member 9 isoform X1 [Micropterus dolomieu]XP_045901149.1 leukocyte receptor cluster member 9 isoform X1 [Micropterus dolomieu]